MSEETPRDPQLQPKAPRQRRLHTPNDAPELRDEPRARLLHGSFTPNDQRTPPPEQPSGVPTHLHPPEERPRSKDPVERHPPDHLQGVPVRANGRNLGRRHGYVPAERADSLPVGGFRAAPPEVLKGYGNALLAVAFQALNAAKAIMESPESQAAALAASKIAADIAYKGYAMGWGSKIDITVKSQEDLPRWDDIPEEVRTALENWKPNGD